MAMLRFHIDQRLLCIHQQITDRDADLGFVQLQIGFVGRFSCN
jgi:hypothetical protein